MLLAAKVVPTSGSEYVQSDSGASKFISNGIFCLDFFRNFKNDYVIYKIFMLSTKLWEKAKLKQTSRILLLLPNLQ